jgi:hypothetical protein
MDELLSSTLAEEVEGQGFAIIEGLLPRQIVENLLASLDRIAHAESTLKRGGVFAIRNLLDVSAEIRDLANSQIIRAVVCPVLGTSAIPVRGILFDKIPDANWKVPYHQDVTIAVRERVDAEGFGPWSTKAGVLHVQPPASVLENMLSVRLHLDPCGEKNGALRVLPKSHKLGRIGEHDIAAYRAVNSETVCAVSVGGALLMRPLLLHASSPSTQPGHRRVIHIDYAAVDLPDGMQWCSDRPN